MKPDTTLVTAGRGPHDGPVNPPVHHASTILFPTLAALEKAASGPFDGVTYGRRGTEITFALEDAVAAIEGGHRSVAVASGLAAVVAALMAFVKAGDHLLMADSAYAPTRRVCRRLLAPLGIEASFYDPLVGGAIGELMRPDTKAVFLESPGSLTFEVQDVRAITDAAHARGAVVILDNTWASPLFFKPFEHGVDVSVQAATKYIAGHSDLMLGVITTTEAVHEQVRWTAALLGACPGPDDCYLALRGLRTLAVRMPRHQETGLALARWLSQRPEVARVMHPALPDSPGHSLWRRDFLGASGLFGVVLEPVSKEALSAMLDGMELFGMGWSWGGYESLIAPTEPARYRSATEWREPGTSLRLHAGLEHPDDLIADLEAGFERLNRAA